MHEISVSTTVTLLACWLVAFAATLSRIASDDRRRSRRRSIGAACFSGWLAIVFVTCCIVLDRGNRYGPLLVGISALIGLMGEALQRKTVDWAAKFGQTFVETWVAMRTKKWKDQEEKDEDETPS